MLLIRHDSGGGGGGGGTNSPSLHVRNVEKPKVD